MNASFSAVQAPGQSPVVAIIAGIGLTYVLLNVITNVWGAWPLRIQTPFRHVFRIGSGAISPHNIVTTAVAVSITALLYALLKWTKFGCAIRAVSQDREEASLIGVNVNTVGLVTFAIGTMLASIGGMFAAPITAASPTMGGTAETYGIRDNHPRRDGFPWGSDRRRIPPRLRRRFCHQLCFRRVGRGGRLRIHDRRDIDPAERPVRQEGATDINGLHVGSAQEEIHLYFSRGLHLRRNTPPCTAHPMSFA